MTLKTAQERFTQAQEIALQENDEFRELMAIGMTELCEALQKELKRVTSKLDDLERRVKQLG